MKRLLQFATLSFLLICSAGCGLSVHSYYTAIKDPGFEKQDLPEDPPFEFRMKDLPDYPRLYKAPLADRGKIYKGMKFNQSVHGVWWRGKYMVSDYGAVWEIRPEDRESVNNFWRNHHRIEIVHNPTDKNPYIILNHTLKLQANGRFLGYK